MSLTTQILPPSQRQSPTQSDRLLTPVTHPVPLLSSQLAKRYSLLHIALIPSLYYLRSSSLISDPLSTLLQDLIFLIPIQVAFCALCLPRAGTWSSLQRYDIAKDKSFSENHGPSPAGSMRRKGAPKGPPGMRSKYEVADMYARITPTIYSLLLALSLPTVPLTVLALVMGAPLYPYSLIPHTIALAVHVSLLGFMPIFYAHGVNATSWREVMSAWLPFDEAGVWGGTVGCFVGSWVGAIPIALDWDREWQKWPCTVVWGCVMGWALGRLITGGFRLGIGTRISLSEQEGGMMVVGKDAKVLEQKKSE